MRAKSLLFTILCPLLFSLSLMGAQPIEPVKGFDDAWEIETRVYPNPSNGVFTVEVNGEWGATYEVKVVNLIGQTMANKQVNAGETIDFSLGNVPKGVYFLQVNTEQQQSIKRIVIQ